MVGRNMTADEFSRFRDRKLYELVDGVLQERRSGALASYLTGQVLSPNGGLWMPYHGRDASFDDPRNLRIDRFSWQAGSPDEALVFFQRKFASLETEVALIEQRIATTDLSPAQAHATIERLQASVKDARAVGDLDGLQARLTALDKQVDHRREEARAAREQARVEAREIKERIVAEAERIVTEATHWKISGERMRQLLEEWKAAPHADRTVETALWKRFQAAAIKGCDRVRALLPREPRLLRR